jgi:GR25 family glycosyltransferase involved in LPS biosynthesis
MADADHLFPRHDLSHVFDRVICIHLDRRRDRLELFCNEISRGRWPFRDPEIFSAYDGQALGENGIVCCLKSHREAMKAAIDDGAESVLIVEDDLALAPDFDEHCRDFFSRVPYDWDAIFLGHQEAHWVKERALWRPLNVAPGVDRLTWPHRCHCYGLRGRCLRATWEFLKDKSAANDGGHVDHILGPFLGRGEFKTYAPSLRLAGQRGSHSDLKVAPLPENWWGRRAGNYVRPVSRRRAANLGSHSANAELNQITLPRRQAYADRHGYDVISVHCHYADATWGLLPYLAAQLKIYDQVLTIGSDVVLADLAKPLDAFADPLYGAIVGEERGHTSINNDVMLWQAGWRADRLIAWLLATEERYRGHWLKAQQAMHDGLRSGELAGLLKVLPDGELQTCAWPWGWTPRASDFAVHFLAGAPAGGIDTKPERVRAYLRTLAG